MNRTKVFYCHERSLYFKITVFGYKFKNLAYITDAGFISDTEKEKLKNLDVLVLNCIRKFDPHPAHFILPDVIKLFEELKPKKLFLTHISHHLGLHDVEDKQLPLGMHLAYDGLEINF
jgi:phosphoribosyl 1,2-cyclic phosphate phosphodiesterase